MRKYLTLIVLSITLISVGWSQCNDNEVELWGECYSIENTDSLNLFDNELTGTIPPEIGNLTNLTYLNLGYNQLTGSIPPEIGNLTNLTDLSFGNNQLTGSIPPEIGNLTNLTLLSFVHNQVTGTIPSEIGILTNLINLSFYDNQLTGSIPAEIGTLTNLTFLDLRDNQLTDSIPSDIGNLTNLGYLFLDSNQLVGEIPESICNLVDNNCSISISNNQLCPPYPSCVENYVGVQDTTNCGQVSITEQLLPSTYNLSNPYPNPFNPTTTTEFSVPNSELVTIKVYDIIGNEINTIINNELLRGNHTINWNGSNEPNGVYFIRMESGRFMDTKKVILLK